jgi:predicted dehydrogenase
VDVTGPDNVLVTGTLTSGAVVSAQVGSVPWHGGGYRLEVYGREGTLVLTSPQAPSTGDAQLMGGKGDDPALTEIAVSPRHTWVPESVPQGPAFNIAQLWGRFAESIASGERAEPDFDSAVTRHRLLDAIQRASDTGQRQRPSANS